MTEYKLFWGEMHDNTHQAPDPDFSMDERLDTAEKHLDFYCAAYYPSTSPAFKKGGHPSQDKGKQPLNVETGKSPDEMETEWRESTKAIARHNKEGRFVAFPGFEWQGDGTWGDHNVFFRNDYPPIFRVDTLEELYEKMRDVPSIAIPHHTAYIRDFRGKNWDVFDEELSPFAEIYSIHGSSEGDNFGSGLRSNPFLGPDIYENSCSAALKRGQKVGIVASTDNWGPLPGHYGRGLAAVWAENLTRESLWEAFKARRVYGVSGDRISLSFRSGKHVMGSVVKDRTEKKEFEVSVAGLDEIDYVELVRDEVVIDRFSPLFSAGVDEKKREYQFRFEFGWGPASNVVNLPRKNWTGSVTITEGEIIEAIPCWTSHENSYDLEKNHFSFQGVTEQDSITQKVQNGYVLRIRGKKNNPVKIVSDGETLETTIGELTEGSRIIWNRKESAELIEKNFDVEAEKLDRKDVIFGMAYKTKVHRALPEEAYRINCRFTDDAANSTDHTYRVRVLQKNGQLAWSSPIWFE
ncbi:MAG: DUF3604 domain-containing protein [Spirochaetales bacterium]|nr:DUF3604 domain-containing protein [Spirochaetales bacterium]